MTRVVGLILLAAVSFIGLAMFQNHEVFWPDELAERTALRIPRKEQKRAADAVHQTLTLMGHLYTTGGDRRFIDRMPAGETIIGEMMADVVYLERNRRRQEMELESLDVTSVEQVGPESLELQTREHWRLSFLGLDGNPLANAPRREWVQGRYRVTRTASTWRVMARDLDNLDDPEQRP